MWTAFWVLISGIIIAAVAPYISHEIKLKEFRQKWIDDLRADIAAYIGLCRKWLRAYDDCNGADGLEKAEIEKNLLYPAEGLYLRLRAYDG